MPTAMMTFCVLAPRIATTASAKTISGKLQHDIDGAHDRGLDPAAPPCGEDAERHAEQKGHCDAAHSDAQRCAGADQDAAEDVAAELVGSEPMRSGGRPQRLREVLAKCILRC